MAAAKGSIIDLFCSCYKVPGLKDPILETPHISYLEDRYSLGEQLGLGQFGVIRACSDLLTGEALACKSIAKDRLASADDLVGVKLEIEVMARLSGHPNIVGLKAVYEDDARVHLVMELCAGGELFHRLEQHGCFPEPQAAVLFRPLMEVVMYCHDKGVVHRDLKPENILLATKSSSSPIKLADFGLATYIKPGQSLYGTVGSPFYIAPEVLAGAYNQAADVWSAGVILYILLSGMPPFWGKTKSRIFDSVRSAELRFPSDPWDHVSESAKELVAGMLCRDPVQRMTAEQVLGHPWMKDRAHHQLSPIRYVSEISLGQLSPPSRDASFTSPVPFRTHPDPSSPTFTCRSSFSSFLLGPPAPSSPVIGFSFCSSCEPDDLTFSSPAPAIPTFEFFHRPSSNGQDDHQLDFTLNEAKSVRVQRDSSFGKLFGYPARGPEHMEAEGRRAVATASRAVNGIRSKRNHTIGLGELEQLDLIVSESVIRWASCNLPSALSLRSSLVC